MEFSTSVRGIDVLCSAPNIILSYVDSWCHKICKCVVEIFQNVNNRTQTLCQILRMVTIEIAIKSSRGAQFFASHPASIALPLR